jgi:hypothetical protein
LTTEFEAIVSKTICCRLDTRRSAILVGDYRFSSRCFALHDTALGSCLAVLLGRGGCLAFFETLVDKTSARADAVLVGVRKTESISADL